MGPLASENIGRGKWGGRGKLSWLGLVGAVLPANCHPTAMPAFVPAGPWPQLGWFPRMAKDYFSTLLPRNSGGGLSKYFVTYKS